MRQYFDHMVPLKIKVSMGWLSIYLGFQGNILLWNHQCIKEWHEIFDLVSSTVNLMLGLLN